MKNLMIVMLTMIALISCNSANVSEGEELSAKIARVCGNNDWLNQEIEKLDSMNTTARLTQYTYRGQTFFEVRTCLECADTMTVVYNCEGKDICTFGGIAGFNTCPDFYETAIDKKVIWHN